MTRRAAFRQCDVERALRAAKATGAARVVVRQDGSLAIEMTGDPCQGVVDDRPGAASRREKEIVL